MWRPAFLSIISFCFPVCQRTLILLSVTFVSVLTRWGKQASRLSPGEGEWRDEIRGYARMGLFFVEYQVEPLVLIEPEAGVA